MSLFSTPVRLRLPVHGHTPLAELTLVEDMRHDFDPDDWVHMLGHFPHLQRRLAIITAGYWDPVTEEHSVHALFRALAAPVRPDGTVPCPGLGDLRITITTKDEFDVALRVLTECLASRSKALGGRRLWMLSIEILVPYDVRSGHLSGEYPEQEARYLGALRPFAEAVQCGLPVAGDN
ncbi:hypothetical protein C8Q77DRAFT_1160428 [Trametes polyzona]|nr:hypothetical protein C8Q77DRAFT_1160428 [Trametes polyzona]